MIPSVFSSVGSKKRHNPVVPNIVLYGILVFIPSTMSPSIRATMCLPECLYLGLNPCPVFLGECGTH